MSSKGGSCYDMKTRPWDHYKRLIRSHDEQIHEMEALLSPHVRTDRLIKPAKEPEPWVLDKVAALVFSTFGMKSCSALVIGCNFFFSL